MEWKPILGTQFTTNSFIYQFKLSRNHKSLIITFLHRLEEDSILECFQAPKSRTLTWTVKNLPPSKLEIRQQLKEFKTSLLEFPDCISEVNFLSHIANQLYAILRGRVNGLRLLFPSTDSINFQYGATTFYENSTLMKHTKVSYMEAAMCEMLQFRNNNKPILDINILEIGGGTGGSTFPILKKLTTLMASDSDNISTKVGYTFTDISTFFVSKAKAKFEKYFPTINFDFKLLDIETNPIEQGYNVGDYDIILVADVFHATQYLDDTVKHTRKLLKPNGLLILGEIFQSTQFVECTFGLTEGWWKFSDFAVRKNMPLIKAQEWDKILKKYGFVETFDVGDRTNGVVFALADN